MSTSRARAEWLVIKAAAAREEQERRKRDKKALGSCTPRWRGLVDTQQQLADIARNRKRWKGDA